MSTPNSLIVLVSQQESLKESVCGEEAWSCTRSVSANQVLCIVSCNVKGVSGAKCSDTERISSIYCVFGEVSEVRCVYGLVRHVFDPGGTPRHVFDPGGLVQLGKIGGEK